MPLVTILELPKTKTVRYSLKPLTGDDVIVEINSQEFAKQHHFEWQDDLLIEKNIARYARALLPSRQIGFL